MMFKKKNKDEELIDNIIQMSLRVYIMEQAGQIISEENGKRHTCIVFNDDL